MDRLNASIRKHLEQQARTVASLADLDAFLRARLNEDEHPARARDVEVKRRLLDDVLPIINELDEIAYGEGQGSVPYLEPRARFLKALALPYVDHADYRAEWRLE